MNERIKQIRKLSNLTQQEFADKIKVKRNTVATYEMGRSIPSDSAIALICREFNVNENWLRNGEGPIYRERDGSFTEMLSDIDDSDDDFIKNIIKIYMELDEDSKAALKKVAKKMAEKYQKQD